MPSYLFSLMKLAALGGKMYKTWIFLQSYLECTLIFPMKYIIFCYKSFDLNHSNPNPESIHLSLHAYIQY